MSFTQLEYPLLVLMVVGLVASARSLLARKWIVLTASLYFYAYWDYRFLALILASTGVDWTIGMALGAIERPQLRRTLLAVSVLVNLGTLGFFKYYNFFIESATTWFERWGWHPGMLAIVLPIGISFYTFQTMSYSIDVYRRVLKPSRSLLDFAIYVMFFPQLVAGPIVRAAEFLPQLESSPQVQRCAIYDGLVQILRGFLKKILIADHLAMMVDPVFAAPQLFAGPTVAIALLAYAGQIFGDFSGYSDIAIGSARLLGFELPENFRHPYLAGSLSDFWRRWHITLSTWLRDYVYIPLGGNRLGSARTFVNLLLTMFLGGLWHGAAWNFVVWGAWHGLGLSLERWWRRDLPRAASGATHGSIIGTTVTFAFVLVGWSLFRTSSLEHCVALWSSMFDWQQGIHWYPPYAISALLLLVAEHALWRSRYQHFLDLRPEHPLTPWLVGFAVAALALWSPSQSRPFVYFQF